MQGVSRLGTALSIPIAFLIVVSTVVLAQTPQLSPPPSTPASIADTEVVQRIRGAHGGTRLVQMDFIADGAVTLHTATGTVNVPVTVLRNGLGGQRILFNQSDGKPWDGNVGHLEATSRRVLEFVQTQFTRGVPSVLKAATRSAVVSNAGTKDGAQLLDVREGNGTATRYTLDAVTARLRGMEFYQVSTTDAADKVASVLETYLFSDFRNVNGINTPVKIQHYRNGTLQEELTFTSVKYVQANRELRGKGGTQ